MVSRIKPVGAKFAMEKPKPKKGKPCHKRKLNKKGGSKGFGFDSVDSIDHFCEHSNGFYSINEQIPEDILLFLYEFLDALKIEIVWARFLYDPHFAFGHANPSIFWPLISFTSDWKKVLAWINLRKRIISSENENHKINLSNEKFPNKEEDDFQKEHFTPKGKSINDPIQKYMTTFARSFIGNLQTLEIPLSYFTLNSGFGIDFAMEKIEEHLQEIFENEDIIDSFLERYRFLIKQYAKLPVDNIYVKEMTEDIAKNKFEPSPMIPVQRPYFESNHRDHHQFHQIKQTIDEKMKIQVKAYQDSSLEESPEQHFSIKKESDLEIQTIENKENLDIATANLNMMVIRSALNANREKWNLSFDQIQKILEELFY